ncbi:MAG: hypothetical protein R8P61_37045 [Bacteroidia bacterium]|nr:hypothetical protein [Bacteroidia bacterium]
MNLSNVWLTRAIISGLCLYFFSLNLSAQSPNLCSTGDCPKELLDIVIEGSTSPDPAKFTQRAATFKAAYQKFEALRKSYDQNPVWQKKYADWTLGGENCMRHYQLEARFAHEYSQNHEFKKFIDQEVSDSRAFKKKGFEASRRAIYLEGQMKKQCNKQLDNLNQQGGPQTADLSKVYQKIGEALDYFDKDGKLKMLSDAEEKKKGIEEQLKNLPLGSNLQNTLSGLLPGFNKGKSLLGNFKKKQGELTSLLGNLLPKPGNLLSKLGDLKKLQGNMSSALGNLADPNLLDKLKNLQSATDLLSNNLSKLPIKPDELKNLLEALGKKGDLAKSLLDKQNALPDQLKKQLNDLLNQKKAIEDLLNKPGENLDELKKQANNLSNAARNLSKKATDTDQAKNDLLGSLTDLLKDQTGLGDKLNELEKKLEEFEQKAQQLQNDSQSLQAEVDKLSPIREKISQLKDQLNKLDKDESWKKEMDDCEIGLNALIQQIDPLKKAQNGFKQKVKGLLSGPNNLLGKLSGLKNLQDKIKAKANTLKNKIPYLDKVNQLIAIREAIKGEGNKAKNKKDKLGARLGVVDKLIAGLEDKLKGKSTNLAGLQQELEKLIQDKKGLIGNLNQPLDKVDEIDQLVNAYLNKYGLFDQKEKCPNNEEEKKGITDLENEQADLKQQIEDLQKELDTLGKDANKLGEKNQELSDQIDAEEKQDLLLKEEEKAIQEEFGNEVKLEAVSVEEWAESFEVKRPYWDAVFHPDDEVVEGFKGKYFAIKLKDAEKNVKLLFKAGQYYMDKTEFRETYGSTIVAFVTEALHYMKKGDADQVKLFVQGSADIVGQNTFRGKLDERYMYTEVQVLPSKADKETFSPNSTKKEIPQSSFNNTHLPDLRGRYLKEMISVYSRKLKPIQLEGAVKDIASEGERNAIIYLFFPETLLEKYED